MGWFGKISNLGFKIIYIILIASSNTYINYNQDKEFLYVPNKSSTREMKI
jgi:hypothetical protein